VVFMIESFHRLAPISPLLNVPAGLVATVVTPLGLLLVFAPEALAAPIAWLVQQLVHGLFALMRLALSLPYASLRVPSAPLWIWVLYAIAVAGVVSGIHRKS